MNIRATRAWKQIRRGWQLYLLLALPLAWLLVFAYYPMYGAQIAFRDFLPGKPILASEWIGLANFQRFFESPMFMRLMRNTLGLSVYSLLVGYPIPILLALSLNQLRTGPFKRTVQMVSYAPHFISTVVMVGLILQFLDLRRGPFNLFLQALGLPAIHFMGSADLFPSIYVWSGVWQNTGFATIIYLAALTTVDPALHEAAVVDGANRLQRWKPIERPARAWAKLARQAGMKYMVMTTKHHEGFCLWDTQQTDYNAVKRGPGRDLVREFVEACREFGLRIGLYYSLMDWHHPDGALCAYDEAARQRFLAFTKGCVAELLTHYGKIDVLWYDVSRPLTSPEAWDSVAMNTMARQLQPDILINNRSQLDEDFGTPEERIVAEARAWEACMTFNGSWGYMPSAIDWHSSRAVVQMLRTVASQCGNLLLNIGPAPDGSIPPEATERLGPVGAWIAANGEALYGEMSNTRSLGWMPIGSCTLKGNTAYYWVDRWPGRELVIGGLLTRARAVSYLATGEPIRFEQEPLRLVLKDLPASNPDPIVGVCVIKVEFEAPPVSALEAVYAPQLLKAQGRPIEFVTPT